MSSAAESLRQAFAYLNSKATIVRGEHGRPIRSIVEWAHRKPTGKFVSLKSGRAMPWESFHELHLMMISEADADVERFLAQPFRIEIKVKKRPKPMIYLPDLERHLSDKTIEIIEVKKTDKEINEDPYYAFKIAMAKKVCRAEEYSFRVMTAERHIEIPHLMQNAKSIVRDRFTRLETADIAGFCEVIDDARGVLAYRKAVEVLSETGNRFDANARAKLHALIARRVAAVDIYRPIGPDTKVTRIH